MKLNIIFIHGYESSGEGFKGNFLRKIFPHILTPNFHGELEERMKILIDILKSKNNWVLIGSSFGGLMASVYAAKFPEKLKKIILLAPALIEPFVPSDLISKELQIKVQTIVFHGKNDDVVASEEVYCKLKKIFPLLTYHIVDDDHMLHSTTKLIDWKKIVN